MYGVRQLGVLATCKLVFKLVLGTLGNSVGVILGSSLENHVLDGLVPAKAFDD